MLPGPNVTAPCLGACQCPGDEGHGGGPGGPGRRKAGQVAPCARSACLSAEPSTCQLISRQVLLMDLLLFLVS